MNFKTLLAKSPYSKLSSLVVEELSITVGVWEFQSKFTPLSAPAEFWVCQSHTAHPYSRMKRCGVPHWG